MTQSSLSLRHVDSESESDSDYATGHGPAVGRRSSLAFNEAAQEAAFFAENHDVDPMSFRKLRKGEDTRDPPIIRSIRFKFGILVFFIVLFSIMTMYLGQTMIDSVRTGGIEMNYLGRRYMHSLMLRFYVRELVINDNLFMESQADAVEHILEEMVASRMEHEALKYGGGYGMSGMDKRYTPQEKLLYGQECLLGDESKCDAYRYPKLTHLGLENLMRYYWTRTAELMNEYTTLTGSRNTEDEINADPRVEEYLYIAETLVLEALMLSDAHLVDEMVALTASNANLLIYLLVGLVVTMVVLYILVLRGAMEELRKEGLRAQELLLLFPREMVNTKELRRFFEGDETSLDD
jgi:hypothetical protein